MEFLKEYWWVLLVAVIAIVLIIVLVKILSSHNKEKELPVDYNEWIIALGNKENILDVNAIGSRLILVLNNKDIIDKEKLSSLGVSNIVSMSNKITLVIENKAQIVAENIKKVLG